MSNAKQVMHAGPVETGSLAVLKRRGHFQLIMNEKASPLRIITGYPS